MIINPKDDYEKLAKLIYPSIEASGNVYYGQTRKLTMDALLKQNDTGLISHMDSFYEYYDADSEEKDYIPYFCWKLGGLKGAFRYITQGDYSEDPFGFGRDSSNHIITLINPYENEPDYILHRGIYDSESVYNIPFRKDPEGRWHVYNYHEIYNQAVFFAKYRLIIDNSKIENIINSGKFNTYESAISCEFDGICSTYGFDPTDKTNYDIGERRFFIGNEGGVNYLYIKIPNSENNFLSPTALPLYKPLTFKAVDGNVDVVVKSIKEFKDSKKSVIYYRVNKGEWLELVYTDTIEIVVEDDDTRELFVSQPISLNKNDSVEMTCLVGYFNRFAFSGDGFVEASGDATSMLHLDEKYNTADDPLSLYKEDFTQEMLDVIGVASVYDMISLDMRDCASTSSSNFKSAMLYMFKDCTKLIKAPYIGKYLTWLESPFNKGGYTGMFYGCTSLINPPYMPIWLNEYGNINVSNMFAGCTSLVKSPEFHFTTASIGNRSFVLDNIFAGCTSLKDIYLCEVYSEGSEGGGATLIHPNITLNSEWLANVPDDCIIHLNEKFDETNDAALSSLYITDRKQYIEKEEYHAYYDSSGVFNAAESDLEIPYTTPYMLSSGGGVIYADKTFDELDETLNTYNIYVGSYNQAVYGYKKFLDRVRFENNIAVKTINLSTADNNLQIKTNDSGSIIIQKTIETGNQNDILSQVELKSTDTDTGKLIETRLFISEGVFSSSEKGSISLTYDTGTGKSKVSIDADEIYINGTLFTHD